MKQPVNGVRITLVPTPWEGPAKKQGFVFIAIRRTNRVHPATHNRIAGQITTLVRSEREPIHAAPPAAWACRRARCSSMARSTCGTSIRSTTPDTTRWKSKRTR